jgi:enterochelin esterase-like enzyme
VAGRGAASFSSELFTALKSLRPAIVVAVAVCVSLTAAAVALARALAHQRVRMGADSFVQAQAIDCPSPALGGRLPAIVYLPPGYPSRGRYPVIYFLHGLPAGPQSYRQFGFVADRLAATPARAIVVVPQGARSANSDREYLDWSADENWPRAISHDLPACIDARYRTIARRVGRVLAGLSAGAYGAFNIGLRSLQSFGAVESWSGYFAATNPAGTEALNLGSSSANWAARVPRGAWLRELVQRYPSYIGFFVGRSDERFYEDNEQFDQALSASGVPHVYRVYPGGHSTSLWESQAGAWLDTALAHLGQSATSPAPATSGGAGL